MHINLQEKLQKLSLDVKYDQFKYMISDNANVSIQLLKKTCKFLKSITKYMKFMNNCHAKHKNKT